MPRIAAIQPEEATGRTKQLFDTVKSKLGLVPNMTKAMAASPAVLDAYLAFSGALAGGALSTAQREQLALVVGEANSCDYCLAAHGAIGHMVGLTDEQISDARGASAADTKTAALLRFAKVLVEARGQVTDADVEAVRRAGATEGEVAETVGAVALNIFTNYFNTVAGTEIDFPAAKALVHAA